MYEIPFVLYKMVSMEDFFIFARYINYLCKLFRIKMPNVSFL